MRHVNGVYTQRFNHYHKLDGQLFRGRYKAILVEEDSYLLELLRYIHLNPLRAGLTNKIRYRWSSHAGYLSQNKKWVWLYKNFLLTMFSPNPSQAKERYLDFVSKGDSKDIVDFFDKLHTPSILGRDDFVSWVKKKFFKQKLDDNIPESKSLAPTLEQVIPSVCLAYNAKTSALRHSRRGVSNEARNVAIYLARHLCGLPLRKISTEFNITKESTTSSVVIRMAAALKQDKALQANMTKIKSQTMS